jgi:hypothetical protein
MQNYNLYNRKEGLMFEVPCNVINSNNFNDATEINLITLQENEYQMKI